MTNGDVSLVVLVLTAAFPLYVLAQHVNQQSLLGWMTPLGYEVAAALVGLGAAMVLIRWITTYAGK